MSKRLQVVFCTDGVYPQLVGGIQKHTRLLVEELARTNELDIVVIHQHHEANVFDPSLKITEVGIKRNKHSSNYLLNEYYYSQQVFQELQNFPDALIYAQGFSVWHNISKIGHRVILNPHGLEFYQALSTKDKLKAIPYQWIFGYLFSKAHRVVSLGGRLTGLLKQHIRNADSKIVVLPNAINLPAQKFERKNYNNTPLKVLFVGRFAANKGINILMDAATQMNKGGYKQELEFHLVGKGPLFEHFTSTVKEPNIIFHGFADDAKLNQLYCECDIFVLPTLFEGMPTVVLEAMSYSLPIIVTDTGATTEMVDQQNGYIIEKSSVKSLKDAISQYFVLNENARQRLSEKSYQRVQENFTWSVVAREHLELFIKLASTNS
ncbi:MAG: Glycosyltransferase Gtf1 [Bacteroidia bacterium]|nr:Glycosyltransferase Gtf1 [Bacteroidia bacterium]MBX3106354.1 glycosyltransferase family 4 protein [Bacteroidota bacterium]MCB8930246.1 glycosyltransferase family 4 protein [Bacteroidia bacterium]MCW5931135.1 glycosyltransferase family 4 protein [Bacteroidota bacterium]